MERRLVGVQTKGEDARGKPKVLWRIAAADSSGTIGYVAGWANARFHSYTQCMDAIDYIETVGGIYHDWLLSRRKSDVQDRAEPKCHT